MNCVCLQWRLVMHTRLNVFFTLGWASQAWEKKNVEMLFQQRDFFSASAILCFGAIFFFFLCSSLCLLLHIIMVFNFIVMHTRANEWVNKQETVELFDLWKKSSARIAISLENVAYHTVFIINILRNERRKKQQIPSWKILLARTLAQALREQRQRDWRGSEAERERETNGRQHKIPSVCLQLHRLFRREFMIWLIVVCSFLWIECIWFEYGTLVMVLPHTEQTAKQTKDKHLKPFVYFMPWNILYAKV